MASALAINRSIRLIHESALAAEQWPQALAAVADTMAAPVATLSSQMPGTPAQMISIGLAPEHESRLGAAAAAGMFPFALDALAIGMPTRHTQLLCDRDFSRSAFYNEAVRPIGTFYALFTQLEHGEGQTASFKMCRRFGAPDYEDESLRAMKLIAPHLAHALKVQVRLAAADLRARNAHALLDRLSIGVVLLDRALRPTFVNRRAAAIASANSGLVLSRDGINALAPRDARRLRGALAAALAFSRCAGDGKTQGDTLATAPLRLTLQRAAPRKPLRLAALPLNASEIFDVADANACIALLLMEPDASPQLPAEPLADLFHFAPREAALAALLARGLDLAQAAHEMHIGIGTARGYLKRVLEKTGTHRQAELVALLLRNCADPLS